LTRVVLQHSSIIEQLSLSHHAAADLDKCSSEAHAFHAFSNERTNTAIQQNLPLGAF
jgi:hypothetical protein